MILQELVGHLEASGGKVELGKEGPSDGVAGRPTRAQPRRATRRDVSGQMASFNPFLG